MTAHLTESEAFATALKARSRYVTDLVESAVRIAAQTRDGEALDVAQFLHSHAVVGLPLPNDRLGVDDLRTPNRRRPAVFLVPVSGVDGLLLSDTDNGKAFASPMRVGKVWASYYRSHHAIYWASEWRLSPLWQSLILLHEGLHAFQHLAITDAPSTRRAREVATTQLEYRLLMSLGGPAFRDLVDDLAINTKAQNRQAARQSATARTLDSIFDKPVSREDEATRATFVESCLQIRRSGGWTALAA